MARTADDVRRLPRADHRVPPHDMEAEQSVLGAMMLSPDAIADVAEILEIDDFYRSAHGRIYGALRNLFAHGEPVDVITAVDALRRDASLDDIGGALYLRDLVDATPTPAGAAHYAKIVADAALRRRLISAAADIMDHAFAPGGEADAIADVAEQRIYDVARREDRDEMAILRDLVDKAMLDLEQLQNRESAYTGLPTGFRDLDTLTSGFQPGNLIVIAARPGIGKSSFAVNIARNMSVANEPVAIFSLEMSRWEIGMRMLCAEARVPWDRIRNKRVGPNDWMAIVQAAETLHDAPLSIVDAGNVNIVDIRAKARRMRQGRKGLSMIIVDYLQLMGHPSSGSRRPDSRQQEIAEISRSLKLLAKELSIPVIAISQLNRNPETRADKRPQLSDLRECVTGDTLVSLADGRRVRIDSLVGTTPEVLAMSADRRVVRAVSDRVWCVGTRPVFTVTLASGRRIRCTDRHRLFGAQGWRRVRDLAPGDRLAIARTVPKPRELVDNNDRRRLVSVGSSMAEHGAPDLCAQLLDDPPRGAWIDDDLFWDRVESIQPDGEQLVYDLTVPGPSSWLADGVVSHNSGAIEQDADLVMFIHRDDADAEKKKRAELIVSKHRNGPTGSVELVFEPSLTQFRNAARSLEE